MSFTTPYAGLHQIIQPDGMYDSQTQFGLYRWHIPDPIRFKKSLRMTMRCHGYDVGDRSDDYSSVAFWYQTGTPTFSARAPDARARALPSLERLIVHARDFADARHHGAGAAVRQPLDFYEGPQLFYRPPSADNAWVEFSFAVQKQEPLRLLLRATRAEDYGKYQALLNGVKLGEPLDFYGDNLADHEFHLLDFWPTPGNYTLRLECVGKNRLSAGHYCGIESVRLRERRPRVTEYGFDKDKDWRQNPRLYK